MPTPAITEHQAAFMDGMFLMKMKHSDGRIKGRKSKPRTPKMTKKRQRILKQTKEGVASVYTNENWLNQAYRIGGLNIKRDSKQATRKKVVFPSR